MRFCYTLGETIDELRTFNLPTTMPDDVSLLLVGGNHTDTTLVQQLHQTVKDLHAKGVPVVLAVENSKGLDVDQMTIRRNRPLNCKSYPKDRWMTKR